MEQVCGAPSRYVSFLCDDGLSSRCLPLSDLICYLGRSDNAIKNRWNVINGTTSPKHDLFNIIAHEQGVSLPVGNSAPRFDYSMYGAAPLRRDFYPKLIANSTARDPPEVSHPFATAAMCWYCMYHHD